jgi:hypothetical protein
VHPVGLYKATTNLRNHNRLLNSYYLVQWFKNCRGKKIKYLFKIFTFHLFCHPERPHPLPARRSSLPKVRHFVVPPVSVSNTSSSECSDMVSENWILLFPVNLLVTHALTCVGHSTYTPGFKHLQHSDVVAGSRTPDRACIIHHRRMCWWTAHCSFFTSLNTH